MAEQKQQPPVLPVQSGAELDQIIGSYYAAKGVKGYFNAKGIGKLMQYCNEQEFEADADEFEQEFEPDQAEDNEYINFDDESKTFPFSVPPKDEKDRREKLYRFLKYCYLHGTYPPEPDDIVRTIRRLKNNEQKIAETGKKYEKQCPKLYQEMQTDKNVLTLLSAGEQLGVPFLQCAVDIFKRDRMQWSLQDSSKPLMDWGLRCDYLKAMKDIDEKIYLSVETAIRSCPNRIQPGFQTMINNAPTKIADDISDIARYFAAAANFVVSLIEKKKNPFQFDLVIAVKEATKSSVSQDQLDEDYGFDDDDDDDDDDEEDEDEQKFIFNDCLGDIQKKLNANKLANAQVTMDQKEQDNDALSRLLGNGFSTFEKQAQKDSGDSFPRNNRFVGIFDRRKLVGSAPRKTNGKHDLIFSASPSDASSVPPDALSEKFLENSRQCLIPHIGYPQKADHEADKKPNPDLVCITTLSACQGAMLTFSFHVIERDQIRCYLWWHGKCIRFLADDVVALLPKLFDESYPGNGEFKSSELAKSLVERVSPIIKDRIFDQWVEKLSVPPPEKPKRKSNK